MRIDHKPVESPPISWAECRRERLLFRRLVLMSAMELSALALCVLALIAIIAFIQGQHSIGVPAILGAAALACMIAALETAFRFARRSLIILERVNGEAPSEV